MSNASSVLQDLIWYSVQFLGDFAAWIMFNPVVFILAVFLLVWVIFSIVRGLLK